MFALSDERNVAALLVTHARSCRRLRLEIAALLGNPAIARELETAALGRPGVVHASANPRSGRLLIEYAEDAPVLDELERLAQQPKSAGIGVARAWHAEAADVVLGRLDTSAQRGLSDEEAARRLGVVGANVLEDGAPASRLAMLGRQLTNVPTALLLGSTVVSILLGDFVEAAAIVAVIGLDTAIGYRIERRSAELLASWRVAELGTCEVIRGASIRRVPTADLVPGDVLVVRAGTVVGADARVIDAHRLSADEAALTGESEPVMKRHDAVRADAALADRRSMLHRGTTIASGHGRAVVVATGAATEIASVQRLAAEARAPQGGLHGRLAALSSRLAWAGMAATGLAAGASLAWRRNPLAILRTSVALGVAAIPEGLPVSATAALVRAMAHLRERGIVVRRLATAETLGGVTVACTDKTGTLTENRMRVDAITIIDDERLWRVAPASVSACAGWCGPIGALIAIGVLNSDVDYLGDGQVAGSSTERALIALADRAGIRPLAIRSAWPRQRLIERHAGASYVISEHDGALACIKGAPEQVVPLCELAPGAARAILAENAALAGQGLRVLALGWRRDGQPWRLVGLVGMRDPLRAGSAEAVHTAARAGIRTVMITGDQRATAEAIARQAGLTGTVIEGSDLPALLCDPAQLRRVAAIARVAPGDKVAVIEALRRAGEIVAMIGDGINDAPALRAADVGIAVGARSSDLARQTADVVLEHEDLRTILHAVAEGRAVQDNLRRSIRFQAAGNLGEILLALGAAAVGGEMLPSLALLWINLLTDTLPGLALALEPTEADLLDRPPARPNAPILEHDDWTHVGRDGALLAAASGLASVVGGPLAAFGVVGAAQFGYATTCRAVDQPMPHRFAALVGGSALLHALAVASRPSRIAGSAPIALACTALGLATPLYLAWRARARYQITRRGRSPKEAP